MTEEGTEVHADKVACQKARSKVATAEAKAGGCRPKKRETGGISYSLPTPTSVGLGWQLVFNASLLYSTFKVQLK